MLIRENLYTIGDIRTQKKYLQNGFLVIKANGKWCIPRGAIDVSWYEQ